MAYVPIADTDINAPLAGNAAVWTTTVANDHELWGRYEPSFETNPLAVAATATREFRFRVRGGDSLVGSNTARMSVAVAVRAVTSGGGTTSVSVRVGDDTSAAALSVAALGWYETTSISLMHSTEPREVVISAGTPSGGNTAAFHAIRCSYEAGAATGLYTASGRCKVDSFWSTADRAVPSEVVSRLRSNTVAIARSRPWCVAFHCADIIRAVSNKSVDLWGVEDVEGYQLVGRLQVPYVDREARTYIIDAYTTDTPGTAEFTVRVGQHTETWMGRGWHSWTVYLVGGPHEITALINVGLVESAAIRTFQVWRMEGSRDGQSIFSQGHSEPFAADGTP